MDGIPGPAYDSFKDFRILLNFSYGIRYQDFVEQLVQIETKYNCKYMEVGSDEVHAGGQHELGGFHYKFRT